MLKWRWRKRSAFEISVSEDFHSDSAGQAKKEIFNNVNRELVESWKKNFNKYFIYQITPEQVNTLTETLDKVGSALNLNLEIDSTINHSCRDNIGREIDYLDIPRKFCTIM